ncbi:tyrosine-type recombinase/integrase [Halomicronema sp. CCY15110]|uniref:tyrosine-type recombinase/integrase n=1 Tax=Halomicronema sp. CCY15110 TaxID=2767773 RepID=UPI00194F2F35|nr:tyrosine-type recombinase/integrase [Halomicronema sp. CCY15110]
MQSTSRKAKGTVGIEAYQGRLRLRLPRQLFDGKQKYLSLGLPDTSTNRKAAEAKAKVIESDIAFERFDATLVKYGKAKSAHLRAVEALQAQSMRVLGLWTQFADHKKPSLKAKTCEKYDNLTALFEKLGDVTIDQPLIVKQRLEQVTTLSRTKDALMYLSAACKWGMKHNLVSANYFEGMANEMPKHRYQVDPQPNAFTEEERDAVIDAFKNDDRSGMNYRRYAPFAEFLFFTGCRPSEAVGLQWQHVSDDCGTIRFEGALVQIRNRRVRTQGSKNNRTRKIAVSKRVQQLLKSIKPDAVGPEMLVFQSSDGDSISYRNFSRRAWKAIADPIKPATTPYSCRDTFITTQLIKGVSSSVIAKWYDTSTQMIDKNYADRLKLSQLRPRD